MEAMREHEVEVHWAAEAGDSTEHLRLGWENEGWTADGTITSIDAHASIHYVIRLDPEWHVRHVLIFRDLDEPDLWLARDREGTWGEVNGATRDDLEGCTDVHVVGTPFTLGLPQRRLDLAVGEHADVLAAQIDPETLQVEPVRQRWRRTAEREVVVSDLFGVVELVLALDEHGIVVDEPGARRRVHP